MELFLQLSILLASGLVADWSTVPADTYSYPESYAFEPMRTIANMNIYPVPYGVQSHSHAYQSECDGSTSTLPPWNSYFATRFIISHNWSGESGPGIVPAQTARYYELRITTNGGQEKWVSVNPVQGPFSRYRNDRTAALLTEDQSLEEGPGGGGNG